ncbi:Uncharacterized conserved protein [Escherichia coli]|nr:Uncharacterized conserved protein [Escherichia coli]
MSVPQTKAELLLAIDKNFSKLISYLNTIPPEITSDKSMDGHAKGTEMSVRDLVSYLLGWNALVVKWIASDAKRSACRFFRKLAINGISLAFLLKNFTQITVS